MLIARELELYSLLRKLNHEGSELPPTCSSTFLDRKGLLDEMSGRPRYTIGIKVARRWTPLAKLSP